MQAVTSFHPNRLYLSSSGMLVYMLAVNNSIEGLGVIAGPILANAHDNVAWCSSIQSHLSIFKLWKCGIDETSVADWYEIDLPKRLATRIYIALREIADLFTHLSKSMHPSILALDHDAEEIPEGTINQINKALEDTRGLWLTTPQHSYFNYPASFVFEDEEGISEFRAALPHLTRGSD